MFQNFYWAPKTQTQTPRLRVSSRIILLRIRLLQQRPKGPSDHLVGGKEEEREGGREREREGERERERERERKREGERERGRERSTSREREMLILWMACVHAMCANVGEKQKSCICVCGR